MARRVAGVGVWTDRQTGTVLGESDTVQCCHCQAHIFVKPGTLSTVYRVFDRVTQRWREEPGAWCRNCNKPVCLDCHEHGRCTPIELQLELSEKATAMRDALARLGRYTKGDPDPTS